MGIGGREIESAPFEILPVSEFADYAIAPVNASPR